MMTASYRVPLAERATCRSPCAWDGALGNHSWISVAYAEALARETGQTIVDPAKLVAPMLTRFMATDRAFKSRRMRQPTSAGDG